MDNCDEARAMWQAYLATLPEDAQPATYMTWHFSSSKEGADTLGAQACAGTKTATASLLWEYEADDEELPQPGDRSIITDWDGRPLCIIETTGVEVVPFDEVDAAHAAAEGDDDPSLARWRELHWRAFSRTCERIGRQPAEDMPVVCERFRRVFPSTKGAQATSSAVVRMA